MFSLLRLKIALKMKVIGKKIIEWYSINKRDLPWRETQDPYKIWLSEIILQQTRVDQGLSYYFKFLQLFPTIHSLANASEDVVLKTWQGLGYYSRARNLHASAKFIAVHCNGVFPGTAKELLQLKGVGPYTASAIASFCYQERTPVIDGNVIRVISRLFAIDHPADTKTGLNRLQTLAEELIQDHPPGNFNQAMMEFGALYCTPVNPRCSDCPLSLNCKAYVDDCVAMYPLKKKKTIVKDVWFYYFVLTYRGNKYMKRRNEKGIWHGLYDFPLIESEEELELPKITGEFLKKNGLMNSATVESTSSEYTHLLSHRRIHAYFIELKLNEPWQNAPENIQKVSSKMLDRLGIPRLIDRFLHTT
jgi:A/G-specific adenine glycosylase